MDALGESTFNRFKLSKWPAFVNILITKSEDSAVTNGELF